MRSDFNEVLPWGLMVENPAQMLTADVAELAIFARAVVSGAISNRTANGFLVEWVELLIVSKNIQNNAISRPLEFQTR